MIDCLIRPFLILKSGSSSAIARDAIPAVVAAARRAIPLGRILVRSGRITSGQLEAVLAEQRQSARRLGDLVIERGLVTREAIDQALRDQVAEEIYELFAWPEARFYFAEAE